MSAQQFGTSRKHSAIQCRQTRVVDAHELLYCQEVPGYVYRLGRLVCLVRPGMSTQHPQTMVPASTVLLQFGYLNSFLGYLNPFHPEARLSPYNSEKQMTWMVDFSRIIYILVGSVWNELTTIFLQLALP